MKTLEQLISCAYASNFLSVPEAIRAILEADTGTTWPDVEIIPVSEPEPATDKANKPCEAKGS